MSRTMVGSLTAAADRRVGVLLGTRAVKPTAFPSFSAVVCGMAMAARTVTTLSQSHSQAQCEAHCTTSLVLSKRSFLYTVTWTSNFKTQKSHLRVLGLPVGVEPSGLSNIIGPVWWSQRSLCWRQCPHASRHEWQSQNQKVEFLTSRGSL